MSFSSSIRRYLKSCNFSQYVLKEAEKIKKTAHWEVDVEVEKFHAKSGANRLSRGLFRGKTLVYSDLYHVLLRVLPKYADEAEENTILVSSHIDTVFSTYVLINQFLSLLYSIHQSLKIMCYACFREGAGDCSSCIAVMLELARGISQWAHGFKSGVIFLFNTGEEEGLSGAHSFMSQVGITFMHDFLLQFSRLTFTWIAFLVLPFAIITCDIRFPLIL